MAPIRCPRWRAVARLDAAHARLTRRRRELMEVTGKRNLTEPDARFMPVRGAGFILGYKPQLAVTADHIILAYDLVQDTVDEPHLQPMLAHIERRVRMLRGATNEPDLAVAKILADAGYASADNLTAPGPDRIIALGSRRNIAGDASPSDPPGPRATPRQKMAWLLTTAEGRTLYRKRGATVEPVNGHLSGQAISRWRACHPSGCPSRKGGVVQRTVRAH